MKLIFEYFINRREWIYGRIDTMEDWDQFFDILGSSKPIWFDCWSG
jgi:hypothetical protein